MKFFITTLVFFCFITRICSQSCATVVRPQLSDSIRLEFEKKLAVALDDYKKDSANANAILWYGRRLAYLGNYEEAISVFSNGIEHHPGDARMYRHRGHRYITVRCLDKAIDDLQKAASLIKGKTDEVEEDGLPNAKNFPTSTLQSNIWYHLGLACYLKGEYKQAFRAYKEGLRVSNNPDMYVATANWFYITLRKLNKNRAAAHLLATIKPDVELIENTDYLKILLLYKQGADATVTQKLIDPANSISSATYSYGLGNYLLLTNKKEQAKQVFEKIVAGNQWASFGFMAAESELKKMNKDEKH
jgi:tetratricopeptide (TPR) repeat protein